MKDPNKKEYEAPKVTFEADLEVKAGSPCPKGDEGINLLFPEE